MSWLLTNEALALSDGFLGWELNKNQMEFSVWVSASNSMTCWTWATFSKDSQGPREHKIDRMQHYHRLIINVNFARVLAFVLAGFHQYSSIA